MRSRLNLNNLQKSTDLALRNFRLNLASLKLNVIQAKPNRSATISSKLSSHANSTTEKPSTIVLNKKSKKKQLKKLKFQDEQQIFSTSVSSNENDEKKRAVNVGFYVEYLPMGYFLGQRIREGVKNYFQKYFKKNLIYKKIF